MKSLMRTALSGVMAAALAAPMLAPASPAQAGPGGHKGPGDCPPGLAKKHNGCLPPGIAKKRYEIGKRLPDDVRYVPIYDYRRYGLPEPRHGRIYGRVDGDLLLIAEATRRVVDAVIAVDAGSRGLKDD